MEIPGKTVKIYGSVGRRGSLSSEDAIKVMALFENGPTPKGEAYPFKLPTELDDYHLERGRLKGLLHRVRAKYNADLPKNKHLTHRVMSEPGMMYVVIEKLQ